jgi:GntR family transcriptional regulator
MPGELDRNSATPLYEQLASLLREAISDGTYQIRLPSEPDLAEQYGVSRETVRAAVRLLVAEGLVRVSLGKGTFIVIPDERPS